MSASLVGSEMCIRDSASSVKRKSTRPAPHGGLAWWVSRPSRCNLWAPSACLLYTSDAADDM
eukprot:11489875-Alexandrium_andersonii.AAC.1